jgi:hypothetical protein
MGDDAGVVDATRHLTAVTCPSVPDESVDARLPMPVVEDVHQTTAQVMDGDTHLTCGGKRVGQPRGLTERIGGTRLQSEDRTRHRPARDLRPTAKQVLDDADHSNRIVLTLPIADDAVSIDDEVKRKGRQARACRGAVVGGYPTCLVEQNGEGDVELLDEACNG